MPLRVRITNIQTERGKLVVAHEIIWADTEGSETPIRTESTEYPATVTRAEVIDNIRQSAEAQYDLIAAAVALEADMAHTYEYANGEWTVI